MSRRRAREYVRDPDEADEIRRDKGKKKRRGWGRRETRRSGVPRADVSGSELEPL